MSRTAKPSSAGAANRSIAPSATVSESVAAALEGRVRLLVIETASTFSPPPPT
jgi:hypothetical protein